MQILILALILLVASPVFAAGPLNPKTAQWDAPLTNTDTSALIDLSGYNVYVASGAFPPAFPGPGWFKMLVGGSTVTVLAASPAPVPGTKGIWGIVNVPGPSGQKHMLVTAVDLTGVESGPSNITPFVSKAPGVPGNLILLP